jgi:hypothetical protein
MFNGIHCDFFLNFLGKNIPQICKFGLGFGGIKEAVNKKNFLWPSESLNNQDSSYEWETMFVDFNCHALNKNTKKTGSA